jgi:hypothetical protein
MRATCRLGSVIFLERMSKPRCTRSSCMGLAASAVDNFPEGEESQFTFTSSRSGERLEAGPIL